MLGDVVLTVAVDHPHRKTKMHEFLVLAEQPLTALRDQIYCLLDLMEEFAETKASGFFFIEGVFYNDRRDAINSKDYSLPIIEWANGGRGRRTQDTLYTAADMHSTTFNDLNIRLNKDYVYVHQGKCEHVIRFTDMRLRGPADPAQIPSKIFTTRLRRHKCALCEINVATFVLHNNELAPENPCHICEVCLRDLFRGTPEENNIDQTKLHRYYHDWFLYSRK